MTIPPDVGFSADWGQAFRHFVAPMQRVSRQTNCGKGAIPSGLWHQGQLMGQPFMNTVVRIPGPSSVECR